MRTLIEVLTGYLENTGDMAVYAKPINGRFRTESEATTVYFADTPTLDDGYIYFADTDEVIEYITYYWNERYELLSGQQLCTAATAIISRVNNLWMKYSTMRFHQ